MKRLVLTYIILSATALAQRLPLQNFAARDGLISNFVTTIYQDSRGYMWVGTDEGISIFDGHRFKNITLDEKTIWGDINTILESKFRTGEMWIGTNGGGLITYKSGVLASYMIDTVDAANRINSILEMDDGSFWMSTDNGLYSFHNGIVDHVGDPRLGEFSRLARDATGTIWCCDGKSLFLFSPHNRTLTVPEISGLPKDSINGVYVLRDSSVGIVVRGLQHSTVFIVKNFTITKKIFLESLAASFVILDQEGTYWIGSSHGLTMALGTNEEPVFRLYTVSNGLPTNEMTIGYTDREQNIWFGSLGRGLSKLDADRSFQLLFPGLSGKGISDRSSHIWIPSSHGVYEVWKNAGGLWQRHFHTLKMGKKGYLKTVAAAVDTQQNIWVSDNAGSLYHYAVERTANNPSTLTLKDSATVRNGFPRALNITMYIDSKNILWYGLLDGGLAGVDFTHQPKFAALYKYHDGFPIRDVREVYEDRSGNLWVMGFEPASWIVKRTGRGFVIDSVSSLVTMLPKIAFRTVLQTRDGKLWFGSRYHGLFVYDGTSLRQFTKKEGMISNQIWTLAETQEGGLLIGTQAGLMLMPDHRTPRFTSLTQYTPSPVKSMALHDDVAWALTRFELTLFTIPADAASQEFPPVHITSLSVNGVDYPLSEEIALSTGENTVTIDYTAISFRNTGALRFQYKLEPLEEEWRDATINRSVTYANLNPGNYVFAVRSLNQEGKASDVATALPIAIASPFWLRWWFIALVIAALFGVVAAAERLRVRRLLEIEKIRSRIAADLHDDIGSGLTRIALLSDMIHRQSVSERTAGDPQFAVSLLTEKVGAISRELVDAMSDVVWSIDPKNNSMEKLLQRVQTFATEVCEAREMDVHFDIGDSIEKTRVGSDIIRAVLLVAKEALTNVVRHANAKNVTVVMRRSDHHLVVKIRDDGCGFVPGELSRMNGLTNMRTRIEKNGGIFTINSVQGKGTDILATIPLPH